MSHELVPELTEKAIGQAVSSAEQMAGEQIHDVVVNSRHGERLEVIERR